MPLYRNCSKRSSYGRMINWAVNEASRKVRETKEFQYLMGLPGHKELGIQLAEANASVEYPCNNCTCGYNK